MKHTFHSLTLLLLAALTCTTPTTAAEDKSRPLFNGTDLTGWDGVGGPADNWTIKDGVLSCTGGPGSSWLATTEEFADFDLELEFKMPANGNSGVFIRAPRKGLAWVAGMEIQLLDDSGEKWKNLKPAQFTGSIYAVAAPSRRVTKPAGQWQSLRIRCVGRACAVWINNQQVIDANLNDLATEFGTKIPGLKRPRGHIGLQNHGSPVYFRNIRLRRVSPSPSTARPK